MRIAISTKSNVRSWIYVLLILCISQEVSARLFWTIRFHIPFFYTDKIIYAFYPELKDIDERRPTKSKGLFNILMLGGSVLNRDWSSVEEMLEKKLASKTTKEINIYNVAEKAHTSLDSYYKYKYLKDAHFDLVLFYHGINETRANNCPPSVFRQDYSHYSWYRIINSYEKQRPLISFFSFPFTLNYAFMVLGEKMGLNDVVPMHEPKQEWLRFGASVKSKDSFERNIKRIIDLAESRGHPLLLMTFAYYVPGDYSKDKFHSKLLDYTDPLFPVELWGKPDNVIAGIETHNGVVRQIAQNNKNILFADQAASLPKEGKYFHDICHLTHEGSQIFVDNMVDVITGIMAEDN